MRGFSKVKNPQKVIRKVCIGILFLYEDKSVSNEVQTRQRFLCECTKPFFHVNDLAESQYHPCMVVSYYSTKNEILNGT